MQKYLTPIILTALSLLFVWPFFNQGFFQTDDGLWAVVRQASMHNELRQLQFPVRWSGSLNFGYGYPLFNFSYPGPYYMGEIFHLVGFSFLASVKAVFILATVISVLAMYYFASELWKNKIAGVIAALFYLGNPYRLVNLYDRGSIGETVAVAIFPILCLCGLRLLTTGKRRYLFAGSIMLALLLISHNVLAFLFIPFFIYWMIVEIFLRYVKFSNLFTDYLDQFRKRKFSYTPNSERKTFTKHLHLIVVMLMLGIGLSAFFWLPAITELKYTKLGHTALANVDEQFSRKSWVLLTPFARDSSQVANIKFFNRNTEFGVTVAIFAICCMILFYREKYQLGFHRTVLYLVPIVVAFIFLAPRSVDLWKSLPGLSTIDFPWRIWGLLMFTRALIVASLAVIPVIRYVGITLAALALILTFSHTQNLKFLDYPDSFYATNQGTTTSANEYQGESVQKPIDTSAINDLSSASTLQPVTHQVLKNKSTEKEYTVSLDQETEILTAIMYFPGWKAYIDGQEQAISYQNSNGILSTQVPQGTHTLSFRFENTPVRVVANTITIITALFVSILFSLEYFKSRKQAL